MMRRKRSVVSRAETRMEKEAEKGQAAKRDCKSRKRVLKLRSLISHDASHDRLDRLVPVAPREIKSILVKFSCTVSFMLTVSTPDLFTLRTSQQLLSSQYT